MVAAEEPYFTALGQQHGIAALCARQTKTTPVPPKNNTAVLSASDRAVIEATGISPEAFLKNKGAN